MRRLLRHLCRPFVTLVALAPVVAVAQLGPFVPHRLLIKFKPGIPDTVVQRTLADFHARVHRELPKLGIKIVSLPEGANELAAAWAISRRPGVQFSQPDWIRQPDQVAPNDPYYPYEWHLPKIRAPYAWSVTTGNPNILIAVIDTGCDPSHPDLAPKYVAGWNIYDESPDTTDVYGHGTTVAGVAAAASNNASGVASVAWQCRIMPVRVSNLNGSATDANIAYGLSWAADHGARVANVSYQVTASAAVSTGAQYFRDHGGIVVVAAGNGGTYDTNPDNPFELTVSSTDSSDQISTFSNIGDDIDLSAPGQGIWSTVRGGGYAASSGTSYSAPVVAGAAAMLLSFNSGLKPYQVEKCLVAGSDDLGAPGKDPTFGYGRVNIQKALEIAGGTGSGGDTTPPNVSFTQPGDGATLQGTFTVIAQATDNVGVTSLTVSIDGTQVASSQSGTCSYSWDTTLTNNGPHTLVAVARDAAQNASTRTITVTVENTVDTQPPTITITSPTDGSAVSGIVPVTVDALDNVAVTKVELYVDGVLRGESTTAPFTISWSTKRARQGQHTLQTKAYDAANNIGWSQVVTVTK